MVARKQLQWSPISPRTHHSPFCFSDRFIPEKEHSMLVICKKKTFKNKTRACMSNRGCKIALRGEFE